jgi:hypothetical protein
LAQLRPALSLRDVRFAATATGGSMTIMGGIAALSFDNEKVRLGAGSGLAAFWLPRNDS